MKKAYPNILIYTVGAMLLLALLAAFVVDRANISRRQIPVWGEVPEFSFIAAHNELPFGRDDLKGKLSVVAFMFTRCKGPCPIMTPNMAELYFLYQNSDKVQFVSVSVDPARDSLPVLREYAKSFGVTDDRWVYLRAPIEDVAELCEQGFMLAADELPGGHTTKFILVDQLGRIRSYHDGTSDESLELLKEKIRVLAR